MLSVNKRDVLRGCMVLVAVFATAVSLPYCCYAVYANNIKEVFQYTQTQVNFIGGMGFLGIISNLPMGMLAKKYPVKPLTLFGHLATLGYILLWSTTQNPEFYRDHFLLNALYAFIASFGAGILWLLGTTANMKNFGRDKDTILNGLFQSSMVLGIFLIMVIWFTCYNSGTTPIELNTNLANFYKLNIWIYLVINILCLIFYDDYSISYEEFTNQDLTMSKASTEHSEPIEISEKRPLDSTSSALLSGTTELPADCKRPHTSNTALITDPYFQSLLWTYALTCAINTSFNLNVIAMLDAFFIDNALQYILPLLSPVIGLLWLPTISTLTQLTVGKVNMSTYLVMPFPILIVILILYCFFGNSGAMIFILVLFANLAMYTVLGLVPPLQIEYFGIKQFPLCVGVSMPLNGVTSLLLPVVFGVVYDNHAVPGTLYCFGLHCFLGFIVVSIFIVIIIILIDLPLLSAFQKRFVAKKKSGEC